jgi:hypothetical protein
VGQVRRISNSSGFVGVEREIHRARIGLFLAMKPKVRTSQVTEGGRDLLVPWA